MSPWVVICFAGEDRPLAVQIRRGLSGCGMDVSVNRSDAGSEYLSLQPEVGGLVALWTRGSLANEYMRGEARAALSAGKLINVVAGPRAAPFGPAAVSLAGWNGSEPDSSWTDLVDAISEVVDREARAERAAAALPEADVVEPVEVKATVIPVEVKTTEVTPVAAKTTEVTPVKLKRTKVTPAKVKTTKVTPVAAAAPEKEATPVVAEAPATEVIPVAAASPAERLPDAGEVDSPVQREQLSRPLLAASIAFSLLTAGSLFAALFSHGQPGPAAELAAASRTPAPSAAAPSAIMAMAVAEPSGPADTENSARARRMRFRAGHRGESLAAASGAASSAAPQAGTSVASAAPVAAQSSAAPLAAPAPHPPSAGSSEERPSGETPPLTRPSDAPSAN